MRSDRHGPAAGGTNQQLLADDLRGGRDAFRAGFVLPLLTLVRPVESDDEPPAAWLRILVGSARGTADAVLTALQKYDASALTAARAP